MSKNLPTQPSLEHLKSQAKDLLREFRNNNTVTMARVSESLPAANRNGHSLDLKLHDAQSVIAREYGFPSWSQLKTYVESHDSEKKGIGDSAVEQRTGKTKEKWFAILDKWGADQRSHKDIAEYLYAIHSMDGWWAQMVTVEYERARGMRKVHQRCDGFFSVSVTKTYAVPIAMLYHAWADAKLRKKWLTDGDVTIRVAHENKSMRITWIDGKTIVAINFLPKGGAKATVTVQLEKLPNEESVETERTGWKTRLERLAAVLGR